MIDNRAHQSIIADEILEMATAQPQTKEKENDGNVNMK